MNNLLRATIHRTLLQSAQADDNWQPRPTRWQRFVRWLRGIA